MAVCSSPWNESKMKTYALVQTELAPAPASSRTAFVSSQSSITSQTEREFERIFLPHLDAAWNLGRLLMRNAQDAEDVVQESYLRALRGFSGFRGEASRSWLLTIVRNTCFTWMRDNRARGRSGGV